VADLQVAVHEHRRRRPERPLKQADPDRRKPAPDAPTTSAGEQVLEC
jgi:hypothetical protein